MSTSNLTMSDNEMLAAIANEAGASPQVSHLTSGWRKLLGAYYAAVVGGANPYRTLSEAAMWAGIRNALSSDPDISAQNTSVPRMLAQIRNALSDDPDISSLNYSVSRLLGEIQSVASDESAITFNGDTITFNGDRILAPGA